ncbi:MAG: prepilin-type N-terminal cleavage/methylation domain-containing protein [Planctomycetota bacterium]
MKTTGFTIIELLIVVVILGVLASLAIPRLSSASVNAKYTATHAGFRNITAALDVYHTDHRAYPPNAPLGRLPPEMVDYLHDLAFTEPPPIGRAWDWNGTGSGINTFGINLSIHTTPRSDRDEMEKRYDDGDPKTGTYRNQGMYLIWPM